MKKPLTTPKVIKPPTIKVVPTKAPMDNGPYGEATSTLNKVQGTLRGTPTIKRSLRPWTRLRKKI